MTKRASLRRLAARCVQISATARNPRVAADLRLIAQTFERQALRRHFCRMVPAAILALSLVMAAAAHAAPPENADRSLAPWFEGLKQPGTGMGCCSIADCRAVESRVVDEHYEAFIEGRWIAVPAEKVLQYTPNPTGHAVACWTAYSGILCFVRPTET